MLKLIVVCLLAAIGWSIWERRLTWRSLPADQVATMGCMFAGAAIVLFREPHLAAIIRTVYGIPYLEHYFGHLCLLSAGGCQIFAAGCRLVPDQLVGPLMRRMDIPAAVGAVAMLVCLMCSDAAAQHPDTDFLALHCGTWLRLYWLTYAGVSIYLALFLGWLMLALRRDRRSRTTADLFILACVLWLASMVDRIGAVLFDGVDEHGLGSRLYIYSAIGVAALACARSWRARLRPFRRREGDSQDRETQPV